MRLLSSPFRTLFPNHKTQSGQIHVKVVFGERPDTKKDFFGEIATVSVYIDPAGSFEDVCQRAIAKARDFLGRALEASSDERERHGS